MNLNQYNFIHELQLKDSILRCLHITDLHLSEEQPQMRRGLYYEDFVKKLQFVYSVAESKQAHLIIISGDVFNYYSKSRNSDKFKGDLIKLFAKSPVPIYAILGNHDIKSSLDDFLNTPFGLLCQSGSFNLLGLLNVKNKDSLIQFVGLSHVPPYEDVVGDFRKLNYLFFDKQVQKEEKFFCNFENIPRLLHVAVTHQFINQSFGELGLDIDLMQKSDISLILNGHDHKSVDFNSPALQSFVDRGILISHPGCFMRFKYSDKDVVPSIHYIEIDTSLFNAYPTVFDKIHTIKCDKIEIPNCVQSDELFMKFEKSARTLGDVSVEEFLSSVVMKLKTEDSTIITSTSILDRWKTIVSEEDPLYLLGIDYMKQSNLI